jgi:hypothetical protein
MEYEKYIVYFIICITILIIGHLNPVFLQSRRAGKPTDCPNYIWLALISLLVGCLYECLVK